MARLRRLERFPNPSQQFRGGDRGECDKERYDQIVDHTPRGGLAVCGVTSEPLPEKRDKQLDRIVTGPHHALHNITDCGE